MRRMVSRICFVAVTGSAFALLVGCSDTGDSSSVIVEPCASPDASVVTDSGSGTGSDSGLRTPLGGQDASTGATSDGSSLDGTTPADASLNDATLDLGEGGAESGAADAGAHNGTVADADAHDAAVAEAGPHDGGARDSEVVGAGPDSGEGEICDTATGFATGCSPTELAFLRHDPAGACLTCLVGAGAVDDNIFPDTGHECEDLQDPAQVAACYATLDCILNTDVGGENAADTKPATSPSCAAAPLYNISDCYCGAGVATADCAALTAAPVGLCTDVEAAGLGLPSFPTTPVLNTYTNTTYGSGLVNQIFVNAQLNGCNTCF